MRKEVMITAWDIARAAVVEFGGRVVEYLSEALKMAWAKIKGGNKNERFRKTNRMGRKHQRRNSSSH